MLLRIIYVVTVPDSLIFFRGLIDFIKKNGFEVHIVSSPGELLNETSEREKIPVHPVEMPRRIAPLKNLFAIAKLYSYFRSVKPTIVHANFPIGGLLGVLAARLAAVPIVIYGMRGLRFDTTTGLERILLVLTETVSCTFAHRVITNSFIVRQRAINHRICRKEKITVLASGSSNGVDAENRFNPEKLPSHTRETIREKFDIPHDALVLGYIGRIVADKGIEELEAAWQTLSKRFTNLYLLMVGEVELHNPVPDKVMERLTCSPRVRLAGYIKETAPVYSAMDILVLPTRREGFPNTPLEAAAMQLPVVATNVDGCVEAVLDGVTGLLVPVRDSDQLAEAISKLVLNPDLRKNMGEAGRHRVMREFKPSIIWTAILKNYLELIEKKRILP